MESEKREAVCFLSLQPKRVAARTSTKSDLTGRLRWRMPQETGFL